MIKTILTIILIVVAVAIIILVMMQDDQNKGLGALGGMTTNNDTYWGKNKGRSKEGRIRKATAICIAVMIGLTVLLDSGFLTRLSTGKSSGESVKTTSTSTSNSVVDSSYVVSGSNGVVSISAPAVSSGSADVEAAK